MRKNKNLNEIMQEDDFDIQLLYEYLGDPNVRIHPLNEHDWADLQKKLKELEKAIDSIKEMDEVLSNM